MSWLSMQIERLQQFVALPSVLTTIVVIDIAAYFGGLLYWYGVVMAQPSTPIWVWPFIPDCPLFGLLSGLGLLMRTAHKFWSQEAQARMQRQMLMVGGLSALFWLSTYLPGMPGGWVMQRAMLGVWSWALLLTGVLFVRAPAWLLTLFACGAIKYGIWTITAWLLFWRNTAAEFGSPLFTFDSVFMTITHVGLFAQGILLLTYFKPSRTAALISFTWFALSDYVDYGLGWYPALPLRYIPLPIMQWSTIVMTFVLGGLTLWFGRLANSAPAASTVTEPSQFAQPSVRSFRI